MSKKHRRLLYFSTKIGNLGRRAYMPSDSGSESEFIKNKTKSVILIVGKKFPDTITHQINLILEVNIVN